MKPAGAEGLLEEAQEVLTEMDQSKYQVLLLKEDNDKMIADLKMWRAKAGVTGEDVPGIESDDEPSAEWVEADRELEGKLRREIQEALESFSEELPEPKKMATEEEMEDVQGPQRPPTPPPTDPLLMSD